MRTLVSKDLIGGYIYSITMVTMLTFDLSDHYHKKGNMKDLEQCILNINPLSLDIHRVSITAPAPASN